MEKIDDGEAKGGSPMPDHKEMQHTPMEALENQDEVKGTSAGDKADTTKVPSTTTSSYSDDSDGEEDRPNFIAGIPVVYEYLESLEDDPDRITKEKPLPLKLAAREKFKRIKEEVATLYHEIATCHESCGMEGKDNCSLEKNLQSLDAQWGVATETPDHQETTAVIRQVVTFVAEEVSRREPALQCRVIPMGSSFSRLKVGRLDEFDFMLELTHITCGQEGTEVLADADDLHEDEDDDSLADSDDEVSGFEGCHRIHISSPQLLTRFKNYEDMSGTKQVLSAGKIKDKFDTLVSDVLCEIGDSLSNPQGKEDVRTYVGESISHVFMPQVYDGPLTIRFRKLAHPVKVDITSCIKWEREGEEGAYLVPSMSFDTWQKANKLPPDLHPRIKKAVRVSKIIRDMCHLVTGESTCMEYSGPSYFVLKKPRQQYELLEATTEKIMSAHSYGQFGLTKTRLVSYALLGTVIKQFEPDIPLCRLVVSTFGKFENIDPKERALLENKHKENYSEAKRLAALRIVKRLQEHDSDTDAFIRAHTPLWFFSKPPSPEELLDLSRKSSVESFSVASKSADGCNASGEDSLRINVYSVGVEDIRYVLSKLQLSPEKDYDMDEDDEEESDGDGAEEEMTGADQELSEIGGEILYLVVIPDRGMFEMEEFWGFRNLAIGLLDMSLQEFVQKLVREKWAVTP